MIPVAMLLLASALHAGPESPVSPPTRDSQPYVQSVARVAAGEDAALVVWGEGSEVRAARVDRNGATLDEVPLLIGYTPWRQASVARGTTGWLVAWFGPAGIEAKTVADDSTQGPAMNISTETGPAWVAFDGTSFLIAWTNDQLEIRGTRISASGQLIESAFPLSPERRRIVDLFPAQGGGFVLVTAAADVVALQFDEEGRQVSRRVLWTSGLFSVAAGIEANDRIVLGWTIDGDAYVKRENRSDMKIAEGTADDTVAVDDFVIVAGTTYAVLRENEKISLVDVITGTRVRELPEEGTARAASFDNRVLVTTSSRDIRMTILDSVLRTIAPARLVYQEPRLQFGPATAQRNGVRLVAWTEQIAEESWNVMAKIDDGEPFVVGPGGSSVEVATDGQDFLVTWHSGFAQLHFRRVLRDGTMPEPARTVNGWTQGSKCVTWSGSDYIIGYVVIGSAPRLTGVAAVAQRVTPNGDPSGEPVPLISRVNLGGVACASTEATTLFASYGDGRIDGATLTQGGTVSGVFDLGSGSWASVAAHDHGFLAGLSSYPPAFASYVAVSEGGTVGFPRPVQASAVTVAPWPGGYLLLYGTDPLRARTLDSQGNPTGAAIVIASDAGGPALAGNTLVYQRDTDVLSQPRMRVFLRELTEEATTTRRRATRP